MSTSASLFLRCVAFSLSVLLPLPAVAGDEVFRWRDADGVVHYADRTDMPDAEVVRLDTAPSSGWQRQPGEARRCTNCTHPPRCDARRRSPACSRR